MFQDKTTLKEIFIDIIQETWFDFCLYFLMPVCVLGYSYAISDRTISQGYNESLNEAISYPETINHLSDIRYIHKTINTEHLNEWRNYYGFEEEFKENEKDRWKIYCIESLIEFRNQAGELVRTTVSYTQAEDEELKLRLFTNPAYVSGKTTANSCDEKFNVAEGVIWLRLRDSHPVFGTEGLLNAFFEFSPAWVNQTPYDMFQ